MFRNKLKSASFGVDFCMIKIVYAEKKAQNSEIEWGQPNGQNWSSKKTNIGLEISLHTDLQKAWIIAQAHFSPKKLAQKMRKSVNIQICDKTA